MAASALSGAEITKGIGMRENVELFFGVLLHRREVSRILSALNHTWINYG